MTFTTLVVGLCLVAQSNAGTSSTDAAKDQAARLTLEVLNYPKAARRLLVVEEAIGAEAKEEGGHLPWRGALFYALPFEGCDDCEARLQEAEAIHRRMKERRGGVVVVITGRPEDAAAARRRFVRSELDLPITFDAYGMTRLRLGLRGPRSTVVLGDRGQKVAEFGPIERGLGRAAEVLDKTLAEEESK